MHTTPVEDVFPLSPMQQGMLFHYLYSKGSGIDIEQIVSRLREPLNIDALRNAWQQVVGRHEVLRSSFRWEGLEQPLQEVHRQVEIPLVVQDWRHLTANTQAQQFEHYLHEDRKQGFVLEKPPAMRLALFQLADSEFQLVWTVHHILLDGRAFPIVLREVFDYYEANRKGRELYLSPPPSYRQYIEWLQERDTFGDEAFWRERLAGFTRPTRFILPLAPGASQAGDQEICLSEAQTSALQLLAEQNGFTLNTLVQGAWALLLSRYSGEEEVIFGAIRAGRKSTVPNADAIVGVFINTLPVRIRIVPAMPVATWLKTLRQHHLEVQGYECTPLVLIQKWSSVPAGTPLFDSIVVFDYEQLNTSLRSRGPAWQAREFWLIERTIYPLTLYAYGESRLLLRIAYDQNRFNGAQIARLLGHMQTLLEDIAADPTVRLASLSVLTTQGRLTPTLPPRTAQHFSCVLMGEGSLLIQCGEILRQRGHRIHGIISSSPLITHWTKEKQILHIEPGNGIARTLREHPFDYLFSIANLEIIPDEVLALPRQGAINFHDSPLPRYAGLYATSWALVNQERAYGITWHLINQGIDQGHILKQQSIVIAEDETAFTLNMKCYEAGTVSFAELVDELAQGRVKPHKQDLAERTYFARYRRPARTCVIDPNQPAADIAALVRALDFGSYANPLGLPKLVHGNEVFLLSQVEVLDSMSKALAGTITGIEDDALKIATATNDLVIRQLSTGDGQPLAIGEFVSQAGVRTGDRLINLDQTQADGLTRLNEQICRHEAFWIGRLAQLKPLVVPGAQHSRVPAQGVRYKTLLRSIVTEIDTVLAGRDQIAGGDLLVATFVAYFARLSGNECFDVLFRDPCLAQGVAGYEGFFTTHLPLRIEVDLEAPFEVTLNAILAHVRSVRSHMGYARDLIARSPELAGLRQGYSQPILPIVVEQVTTLEEYEPLPGSQLTVLIADDGHGWRWLYDPGILDEGSAVTIERQFISFLHNIGNDKKRALAEIPLLSEQEYHRLVVEWNATRMSYEGDVLIHELFEAQVAHTPEAVALVAQGRQLSYAALNAKANQLAHYLVKSGVGPKSLVGICLERSLELVIAILATHKAGGAYVPMDPGYPKERLAFMMEDAKLALLLTQEEVISNLPQPTPLSICLDSEWDSVAKENTENPVRRGAPDELAYVIYTSGSTGKPKGVMVEHRNVVNFFAGMDQRIGAESPGVWLAVTSLSFDISVLELLWTLARGFKVVLYTGGEQGMVLSAAQEVSAPRTQANKQIEFSLFYFASDAGERTQDKYKLLLEGAKFADDHGFSAIWTPERHFHAFGGLYPNPSVASAAIAVLTKQLKIRAGSVVLPLHPPIRVAEEWALVDNLSQGRVGISFASGWQPNDFAIAPENYADRKDIMMRSIDTVRKLWRGETVAVPGPKGQDVTISTLPRPVQPELPIWLTAAGNPETCRLAGEIGANLLTHLLGQSVEELGEKVRIYREAWRQHGHKGEGHVTLMLHTFVGEQDEAVRETVRDPMKDYLKSAMDLVKRAAWHFPAHKEGNAGKSLAQLAESNELTPEDMEILLNYAFERYFETSGLFGTPETCAHLVDLLQAIAIDEIACLIDFGVDSETVLANLTNLNTLKERCSLGSSMDTSATIPSLIRRHQVTHMQCTPSMARMLMLDPEAKEVLSNLDKLMIGGEAFPPTLAKELKDTVRGDLLNMYGPTETTVWSSTHRVDGIKDTVPIGRPIANTALYVLDKHLQPVPVGISGELFIAGKGVARGYLNHPELTGERFIKDPFGPQPEGQMYRTGDLARYRPEGVVEFLGRMDNQVKIRGYRIELGEIEAVLSRHPQVREVVVAVKEERSGGTQLVGYVVPVKGQKPTVESLRGFLLERLPEYMMPSVYVNLEALPLTPNKKVDRAALPEPEQVRPMLEDGFVATRTHVEQQLAQIWMDVLNVKDIGVNDRFFDLGGHSLSAVQAAFRVRQVFGVDFPLRMLFQAPILADLARKVEGMLIEQADSTHLDELLGEIEQMSKEDLASAIQSVSTTNLTNP